MTGRRLAALAAGLLLVAAGCASNSPGDINAAGTRALMPLVQDVRVAAAAGSYSQLRTAVSELKSATKQQEHDGNVSSSRSNAIQDAADALLEDARAARPEPSPTSESPTPTPTSESPTPTPTSASPTPTTVPTTESPSPTETSSTPDSGVSVGVGDGGGDGGSGGGH